MKYRDLITLAVGIAFILSIGYCLGVAESVYYWAMPLILGLFLAVVVYKLWIEK